MRSIEPTFDAAVPLRLSGISDRDISVLENTIARQSTELNLRLTEVLELYNAQNRQANEAQIAHEEIARLREVISALQGTIAQQKADTLTSQTKITDLESERALLRSQLNEAHRESKAFADQMRAMQTAFDTSKTNAASALEQIQYLNSELTTTAAERFRLVAAVQSEKRRLHQQISTLQDKIKKTGAVTETQEVQINHLEEVRGKLDKRIQVLEALLKSEREIAELKIKRLSDELQRHCSAHSAAPAVPSCMGGTPQSNIGTAESRDVHATTTKFLRASGPS
jgi:chromosome segregation ATPase